MEKDGGSSVGGGDRGRKPLGRETVKGGSFASSLSSVGMVARTGKVAGAAREPMFVHKIGDSFLVAGTVLGQDEVFPCLGCVK